MEFKITPAGNKIDSSSYAVLSKLIKPVHDVHLDANSIYGSVSGVAADTATRIDGADEVLQLLPDISRGSEILIASIFEPNSLGTAKLGYSIDKWDLPIGLKTELIEAFSRYLDDNYEFNDRMPSYIKDAIVTNGATPIAVIPENVLDGIINNAGIDRLSYNSPDAFRSAIQTAIDNHINSADSNNLVSVTKIWGTEKKADITLEGAITIENRRIDIRFGGDNTTVTGAATNVMHITENDLCIGFVNDPVPLIASEMHAIAAENALTKPSMSDDQLSPEVINSINSIFKRPTSGYKDSIYLDEANQKRKSVGPAFEVMLPAHLTIPVSAVNNPKKHLGYVVLVDQFGNLVTNTNFDGMPAMSNSELLKKMDAITSDQRSKSPVINGLENIYGSIIEKIIKSRLANGNIGRVADLNMHGEIYSVMFHRALRNQMTKLLFIPSSMVVYYAVNYRNNGTGKSLLEMVSSLSSLRIAVMLSKVMNTVKNATPITVVDANLPESITDPKSAITKILSAVGKTRNNFYPFGVTSVDGFRSWFAKSGIVAKIKHKSLPNYDIDIKDTTTSRPIADDSIDEILRELSVLRIGITPGMLSASQEDELATSVVTKNILLAKQIIQDQKWLMPLMSKHAVMLLTADNDLINRSINIADAYYDDLAKMIAASNKKEAKNKKDGKVADEQNITKEKLLRYIIVDVMRNFKVTLPAPDLNSDDKMGKMFDDYVARLKTVCDTLISADALPTSIAGKLSDKLNDFKSAVIVTLIRKWMDDNNYLPELTKYLTKLEDSAGTAISTEISEYVNTLYEKVLATFDKVSKAKSDNEDKLSKYSDDAVDTNSGDGSGGNIDADAGGAGGDLGDDLGGGIDDLSADNKDDKSKEKPAEESDKKPNPADENSDNADKTEKK